MTSPRKAVRGQNLFEAFATLGACSREALLLVDREGRILGANAAAGEFHGLTPDALESKNLSDLCAPGAGGEPVAAALRAGVRDPLLTRHLVAGGAAVPVELSLRPLESAGEQFAIVAVERARPQGRLAPEGTYENAFREAGFGLVLLDREGRLLETNEAFRELLDYDAEALAALRWQDLVHPHHRERSAERRRNFYGPSQAPYAEERWLVRRDGTSLTVYLRLAPVRGRGGSPERALLIVEDISARKKIEARLLIAERLASFGTLAAGIAHEINNPIAAVLANMRYVMTEIETGGARPGDLLEAAGDAVAGASRVRDIVRELKQFARQEGEVATGTADVAEVLRSAANLVRHELHGRAQLVTRIDPVPRVAANPVRLGQVFLNLLLNAVQALPLGDPGAHEVRLAVSLAGSGQVLVEVADTGHGIPAEQLERIFDPFFTTREVGEGTGLGLSICHALVTSFGGEIRVESTLGRCSTFRVLLPVAESI